MVASILFSAFSTLAQTVTFHSSRGSPRDSCIYWDWETAGASRRVGALNPSPWRGWMGRLPHTSYPFLSSVPSFLLHFAGGGSLDQAHLGATRAHLVATALSLPLAAWPSHPARCWPSSVPGRSRPGRANAVGETVVASGCPV